jgi:UDP-N-acetylglucosamine--N-acetylmuramyl-(pentapeptide) pyrophosphoryl-undecaprenol N-acetylglucosamine transferase
MQKLQAGFQIRGLWIAGFTKAKFTKLDVSFKVAIVYGKQKNNKEFKPDVVIGTVVLPADRIKMASMMGIPTVIQEQNSYPGITNKLLSKKADAICVYENLERFFQKKNDFNEIQCVRI